MPHILVIDDDPMLRELLLDTLAVAGYQVTVAAQGTEGVALLDRQKVDLVITDIIMGKMDGLSVLRTLRESHPHLPVVVISGGSAVFDVDHLLALAKSMKAAAWIKKPFSPYELVARVGAILAERSTPDEE